MSNDVRAARGVFSARRAIVAATIGNALEFYDFLVYALFAIQIGHALFGAADTTDNLLLSLATFGVGFVTRPIGGLIIGRYSDRAGRRAAMLLSFSLMGVAIVAMALIPPYSVIGIWAPVLAVLARLTMGFSLGGEVGPTTAFLLEVAPVERRGELVSWQGVSQQIAALAGGIVGLVLAETLVGSQMDAYGWRIAFLLGAVSIPFGLWIRSGLPETLHLAEEAPSASAIPGARRVMSPEVKRVIMLGLVVLASGTISTYITHYMTTFAQDSLNLGAGPAFLVEVVSDVTGLVATLYGGWLSDRIGRRPVMIWSNLAALLITYPLMEWIIQEKSVRSLLIGIGVQSLVSSITFGAFLAALAESLPKWMRGGGLGTTYAVAIALFGGSCQFVVHWMVKETGNPNAVTWYWLSAMLAGQIALYMFPESAPVKTASRE